MERQITDTERLDWLIANSSTWNSRTKSYVSNGDRGLPEEMREVRWSGGYWDDGSPNYGGGGDPITPEAEDDSPRTAIDLAIEKERIENGTGTFEAAKPACMVDGCNLAAGHDGPCTDVSFRALIAAYSTRKD